MSHQSLFAAHPPLHVESDRHRIVSLRLSPLFAYPLYFLSLFHNLHAPKISQQSLPLHHSLTHLSSLSTACAALSGHNWATDPPSASGGPPTSTRSPRPENSPNILSTRSSPSATNKSAGSSLDLSEHRRHVASPPQHRGIAPSGAFLPAYVVGPAEQEAEDAAKQ